MPMGAAMAMTLDFFAVLAGAIAQLGRSTDLKTFPPAEERQSKKKKKETTSKGKSKIKRKKEKEGIRPS